jgi:hypothetical protein
LTYNTVYDILNTGSESNTSRKEREYEGLGNAPNSNNPTHNRNIAAKGQKERNQKTPPPRQT